MSSFITIRNLVAGASVLAIGCLAIAPAGAQSGTTAGKAKAKVGQAQAAASGKAAGGVMSGAAPRPAQAAAATQPQAAPSQPPAGAAASGAPGITVIANDPNHISAVKALEQIRRDEQTSSEGNTFTYDPGDRRDPFLSPQDIIAAQLSGQVCQGEGMECWLIQDVTVIGVLTRKNGNVALVIGPDGYGTTLHEGDRLYDGEVRRIDPQSGLVVFRQRINDPTRIKPFRDVEKGLNLNKEGRS